MISKRGTFTLIDCHVTHKQLLFRSTSFNQKVESLNQDMLMVGTIYIDLPYHLYDFLLRHPNDEELTLIKKKIPENWHPKDHAFAFVSSGKTYFVVADKILFQENQLPQFETSIPSKLNATKTIEEVDEVIDKIMNLSPEDRLEKIKETDWEQFTGRPIC